MRTLMRGYCINPHRPTRGVRMAFDPQQRCFSETLGYFTGKVPVAAISELP